MQGNIGQLGKISIHAPHEGERLIAVNLRPASAEFQSTLPTRGSDQLLVTTLWIYSDFNPRSPRGGATQ